MPVVKFGDSFELDPGAYLLRRSGQTLRLERIPMEILLLLMEHRGQLVTREQIVERVWGKATFLDADNSINGAIRKIRQALKDDPEHPRFIQTVTGRGYRFVGPLRETPKAVPQPALPPPRRLSRRWLAAGGIALLVGIGVLALAPWRARGLPDEQRVMLAVLPFENLTGDARQEYFSDGLTEEMITQLGNRDPARLGVIARTSVMQYKTDRAPLERIARELGVQYVLEGSVRRDANHVRVSAQLIRAADQTQIWARQYDRAPAQILTLQAEIAEAISTEIQSSLGRRAGGARSDSTRSARGLEAYDLYLRGQYHLYRRTVPDFEQAIRYFQAAISRDPGYARAYAALSNAYALLAGYSSAPTQPLIADARAAALRALQLDSTLAEAHTAYALFVQNHDWDWKTAGEEFRRGIALNPNYATAHHWYAEHLTWLGRFDEALRESELARRLDPLSPIIAADNGAILYFSRQYDRAIAKWRSVLDVTPNFPRASIIFFAYVERGRYDEALASVERTRPIVNEPIYWSCMTFVYGRAGRAADAQRALGELLQAAQRQPIQSGPFAAAYAGLGDTEKTLEWLERAYAEHSNDITTLKVNPIYDFLRNDVRFQRLLERVGLAH